MARQNEKKRMRIMIGAAAILAVLVGLNHMDLVDGDLPTRGRIQDQERAIKDLRIDIEEMLKTRQEESTRLSALRAKARPFWITGNRAPATDVQTEFEKIARKARVTIQTIGSPNVEKVSENVVKVELSIRMRTTVREFSRLLGEMENLSPPIFWSSCAIRPDHPREPKAVMLTGKIEAYVLSSEAGRLLNPRERGKL